MRVELFVSKRLRDIPATELEVSKRSLNAIQRTGYKTVGELIDNWNGMPKIRNIGKTSVNEIRNAIITESLERCTDEEVRSFVYGLLINNSAESLRSFIKQLDS